MVFKTLNGSVASRVGYVMSLQRNILESKALRADNNLERVVAKGANFPVPNEASHLDLHATTAGRKDEEGCHASPIVALSLRSSLARP